MPCSEKRARLLLERDRAIVKRMYPFMIQLKDRTQDDSALQDIEIKIDPGSKTTGIAVCRVKEGHVVTINLIELEHRGIVIKKKLQQRAMYRRNRRSRKTRYRQARFLNRTKPKGWLPPSLMHRVTSTMNWASRLRKWCPVEAFAVERVKFDMQKMMNPETTGLEYQQGELQGYEVKEYLLEKFNRTCAYCGTSHGIMEVEHMQPKSRGGSNRISNLVLACFQCNRNKGSMTVQEYLKDDPPRLAKLLKQVRSPLRDAAAVNSTRNRLFKDLLNTGLPVMTGTGAQTKHNRRRFNIGKTHALDAACVGEMRSLRITNLFHLGIKCEGRGKYRRTLSDTHGRPRAYLMKTKRVFDFQTGDIVKTTVPGLAGIRIPVTSKIVVRETGYFSVKYQNRLRDTPYKNCRLLQRADGYSYTSLN